MSEETTAAAAADTRLAFCHELTDDQRAELADLIEDYGKTRAAVRQAVADTFIPAEIEYLRTEYRSAKDALRAVGVPL